MVDNRCFNPCCSGLAIKAPLDALLAQEQVKGFNPCCSGLAIKAAGDCAHAGPGLSFQSLLFWISH